MVQVTRDSLGDKGPALTTNVSLPGRYLVFMPHLDRTGVSRKIEDDAERKKLKAMLAKMSLPADMGVIARTAGAGHTVKDLRSDLDYLTRLWKDINKRFLSEKPPADLYIESDLVIRTIRDIFTTDMKEIILDSEEAARKAQDFFKTFMPGYKNCVKLYRGDVPLFDYYKVEPMIEETVLRKVPIPQGGNIIIDETEALVAIDVNSGKFKGPEGPRGGTKKDNSEETAYRTNLAAAEVIAKQLRLRDLGGQVVIDFIDMRDEKKRRSVERTFRDALKPDRSRIRLGKIGRFGMLEMTRQRMRSGIRKVTQATCPMCKGNGYVKSSETIALEAIRAIRAKFARAKSGKNKHVRLTASPEVVAGVLNYHRRIITSIEEKFKIKISVVPDPGIKRDNFTLDLS